MSLVNLTINDQKVQVEAGTTILLAAKSVGIEIPTLCYLESINAIGACRVCVVEVKGAKALQAACVTPVGEGMAIYTNTPAVRSSRKTSLELLISNHPMECLTCIRNRNCELQSLAEQFGIREVRFEGERATHPSDVSSPSLARDPDKCILCRRCVAVCEKVQTVSAIAPQGRGFETVIAPGLGASMYDSDCVNCGQCTLVCPTGALYEKDEIEQVWAAINDPTKHVVVQTAPATRVAIGEPFGYAPGTVSTGKLVSALRRLGFDKVFDTDFTADLTIMEEGFEFIERLNGHGKLPLITSCSPGWVKFIEHFYPELLDNVSTCKSPQQMFGALAKTYYADKMGIERKNMVVVSIMPCTAKKFEARRPEMRSSGYQDVDYVLTTRELARMIKEAGIDFTALPDEEYDSPLGLSTGAAVIFGATGGVMEAALRTAYEVITKEPCPSIEFKSVRGEVQGLREAEVDVKGTKVKVAVANSLGKAREILDRVKAGEQIHFIEIMACPGGCIGGGGQPIPTNLEIRKERIAGIYNADEKMTIRKSHENPAVKALYDEYLEHPLGHKSHELLHTCYTERGRYKGFIK